MIAPNFVDLIGQRFGKRVVLGRAENTLTGNARWNVVCDCGRSAIIQTGGLKKSKSCGCDASDGFIRSGLSRRKGDEAITRKPRYHLASHLQRKFGITLDQYDAMCIEQGNRCAICKRPFDELPTSPHVDHNHITKKNRGLLCHWCNTGMGNLQDSILILESAVAYLKSHS